MIIADGGPPVRPRVTPVRTVANDDLIEELRRAFAPRYEVVERVGEGGMAFVYRAYDSRHERDVAIKIIRPEMAATMAADRFLREIRFTARLQHPNIVALFDSGTAGDFVYYVMPLIEGESLRALIDRERQLPLDLATQLARDVASALGYAHTHGVVHRDIKPENIILSSGRALIADFGVAGGLEHRGMTDTFTTEGVLVGTTTYMSPEQCTGEQHLDGRTDIYAAGCVLYEMLTGEPPFAGRTPQAVMARHVSERIPEVRVLRPEVPPRLARVVKKSLAKTPADRFQTAEAMEAALQAVDRARPRMGVWLAIGAAAAALAAFALDSALKPPTRPLDRNRVAIFPLTERNLPEDAKGAGAVIASVLNSALEHADPLRPLDVQDHLSPAQRNDPSTLAPDARRRIARDAGAAWYLGGAVTSLGDSITVGLRLYDVQGDSLLDQNSETAIRDGTPLHRLGLDAVLGLLPSLVDPGRRIDLAPLRDRRTEAVALFVQGERDYRRSAFPAALRFYRRALAEDSLLVLAAVKGALSAYWVDHGATSELAEYARDRASLLPPRYAAFARGLAAFAAGRADSAETWFMAALRSAPGWPEALYQLAEVYMHLIPARAPLDSLAEATLRLAADADSGFTPPLIHLSEILLREGRAQEAQQLMAKLPMIEPTSAIAGHLGLMLQCVSQGAEASGFWRTDAAERPQVVLKAARMLAVAGRQLPCAETAFRALLDAGPDNLKYGAAFGLQSVLAAQGRAGEVVQLVDSVVRAGRLQALMTTYVIDAAAGLPVDSQALGVEREGQRIWGDGYTRLAESRPLQWLQWLFGVSHVARGDVEVAAGLQRALAASAAVSAESVTRLYADALMAHLTLARGDSAGAVDRYRALRPEVPTDSLTWSMAMPLPVERLRLAQLLLARGDYGAALRTASVFDHPEPVVYIAFVPASLEIRQRAAQAMEQRDAAARYQARIDKLRPRQSAARQPRKKSP